MTLTIHETAETGQEQACYIVSGGGVDGAGEEKRQDSGRRGMGRVDVTVSFYCFFFIWKICSSKAR